MLFAMGAGRGTGGFGVLMPAAHTYCLSTGPTQLPNLFGRFFAYDALHVLEVHAHCGELRTEYAGIAPGSSQGVITGFAQGVAPHLGEELPHGLSVRVHIVLAHSRFGVDALEGKAAR